MGAVINSRCQRGHLAYEQTLTTNVPGATPQRFVMCPTCDRAKCSACDTIDITGTAKRCRCNRPIGLHA